MAKKLTLREAYDKGRATQKTSADWDNALALFSRKYCEPHHPGAMCAFEHAWADGFDDAGEDNTNRRPSK